MWYTWTVCNTKELDNHKFPYLDKQVILDDYTNQSYRLWKTDKAVSLYQNGRWVAVLFLEDAGSALSIGDNNFYILEKQSDGSYDVIHGQGYDEN